MNKMLFLLLLLFTSIGQSPDTISITHNGEMVEVVERSDYSLSYFGNAVLDESKYNQLVENINDQIYEKPVNAALDQSGAIIPEQTGEAVDRKKFKALFYQSFFLNGHVELEVPLLAIHPRVDSELIAEIHNERIGQYLTYFNTRNKERSHNIKLATEAINNYVVFPGETFSFNEVVGKRTVEKGYLPAPIIVKGELSEGIGGGICQVSSTLFNAVDQAGLEIAERYAHSRRVTYVPPGRDATVSWYGPDFKFRNKHNQPILVQARTYGSQLIIRIFSSEHIDYKKRDVPTPPKKLPKEIEL